MRRSVHPWRGNAARDDIQSKLEFQICDPLPPKSERCILYTVAIPGVLAVVQLKNRDRLIDAAEARFKEFGYADARLEDIASDVGLQKTSLYRHIHSKAELLFWVLQRDLETRIASLVEILADSGTARQRLERAIREHLQQDLFDLQLRDLTTSARRSLSDEDQETMRSREDYYAHLFRRIVQDAAEAGVARGDLDVSVMTRFLIGMLNTAHFWFREGRLDKETVIEMGIEMALGAVGVASSAATYDGMRVAVGASAGI